ncbi:MAG TPA: PilN domain-containing protein [Burkholderiaceae bacterium]
MIRINLLPHREAKRKQNKTAFFRLLAVAAVFAGVIAFLIWGYIGHLITDQDDRNNLIKTEIKHLDEQIAEIATLKDEIAALKARQQAVEDLQSDRNQPVYLFDELVKQVPEGVFLKSFKQEGQKVVLVGTAQSNERVSDLLRNLSETNSAWMEKPELVEIKASTLGQGREAKRVFDFAMNVGIKRPRDAQSGDKNAPGPSAAGVTAPGTPAAGAPAAARPVAGAPAGGAPAASAPAASAPKKP